MSVTYKVTIIVERLNKDNSVLYEQKVVKVLPEKYWLRLKTLWDFLKEKEIKHV